MIAKYLKQLHLIGLDKLEQDEGIVRYSLKSEKPEGNMVYIVQEGFAPMICLYTRRGDSFPNSGGKRLSVFIKTSSAETVHLYHWHRLRKTSTCYNYDMH